MNTPREDDRTITSFRVLLARVTWFFIGPLALFLLVLGIASAGSGWATALDVLFFGFVAVMVWCRWVEQRSGRATTAYGEPATSEDFRRYVLTLLPLAAGAWLVANLLGNHIFRGIAGQ